MKETLIEILRWLSGKKGAISSIIGLIIAYFAAVGSLNEPQVILFSGINFVLFGAASYATSKLVYNK